MAMSSLNTKIGPTNADIATAVAAPSAATIAAAVAAPSAATIAAAVAAPSAATIAAAVAAPSSATITSAVTAAGNSAGWGASPNAWTVVSSFNPNSTTGTYTWSGLSGYKAYKLVFSTTVNTQCAVFLRINGVSTASYAYASYNPAAPNSFDSTNGTDARFGSTVDSWIHGEILFPDATLAVNKIAKGFVHYRQAGGSSMHPSWWSTNQNTAAITSISLIMNGSSFTNGTLTLLGAN